VKWTPIWDHVLSWKGLLRLINGVHDDDEDETQDRRGRWTSPPLFDHSLVGRLVEAGYVETRALPTGSVEYQITEAGMAAIAEA
jgi:hypothetical protein